MPRTILTPRELVKLLQALPADAMDEPLYINGWNAARDSIDMFVITGVEYMAEANPENGNGGATVEAAAL